MLKGELVDLEERAMFTRYRVQYRKKKTVSKQIFITIFHVDGSLCKE